MLVPHGGLSGNPPRRRAFLSVYEVDILLKKEMYESRQSRKPHLHAPGCLYERWHPHPRVAPLVETVFGIKADECGGLVGHTGGCLYDNCRSHTPPARVVNAAPGINSPRCDRPVVPCWSPTLEPTGCSYFSYAAPGYIIHRPFPTTTGTTTFSTQLSGKPTQSALPTKRLREAAGALLRPDEWVGLTQ